MTATIIDGKKVASLIMAESQLLGAETHSRMSIASALPLKHDSVP
jgi:hypothetical protein